MTREAATLTVGHLDHGLYDVLADALPPPGQQVLLRDVVITHHTQLRRHDLVAPGTVLVHLRGVAYHAPGSTLVWRLEPHGRDSQFWQDRHAHHYPSGPPALGT